MSGAARDMGWTTIVNGGSGNSRTGLRGSQGLDFARLGRQLENDRFFATSPAPLADEGQEPVPARYRRLG